MGQNASSEQKHGYHVLKVVPDSPASKAGLIPFFDYIVAVNKTLLDNEANSLIKVVSDNINNKLSFYVYSSKTNTYRNVKFEYPIEQWTKTGENGWLGFSVRYCSYAGAAEHFWHVLAVVKDFPAFKAGIQPKTDYIVGSPNHILTTQKDLYDLFDKYVNKPLHLYVYSTITNKCREIIVIPTSKNGEGCIGCTFSYGDRISVKDILKNKEQQKSQLDQNQIPSSISAINSSNSISQDFNTAPSPKNEEINLDFLKIADQPKDNNEKIEESESKNIEENKLKELDVKTKNNKRNSLNNYMNNMPSPNIQSLDNSIKNLFPKKSNDDNNKTFEIDEEKLNYGIDLNELSRISHDDDNLSALDKLSEFEAATKDNSFSLRPSSSRLNLINQKNEEKKKSPLQTSLTIDQTVEENKTNTLKPENNIDDFIKTPEQFINELFLKEYNLTPSQNNIDMSFFSENKNSGDELDLNNKVSTPDHSYIPSNNETLSFNFTTTERNDEFDDLLNSESNTDNIIDSNKQEKDNVNSIAISQIKNDIPDKENETFHINENTNNVPETLPISSQTEDKSTLNPFPANTEIQNQSILDPFPVNTEDKNALDPFPVNTGNKNILDPFPINTEDKNVLNPFPVTTETQNQNTLDPFPVNTEDKNTLDPFPVNTEDKNTLDTFPVNTEDKTVLNTFPVTTEDKTVLNTFPVTTETQNQSTLNPFPVNTEDNNSFPVESQANDIIDSLPIDKTKNNEINEININKPASIINDDLSNSSLKNDNNNNIEDSPIINNQIGIEEKKEGKNTTEKQNNRISFIHNDLFTTSGSKENELNFFDQMNSSDNNNNWGFDNSVSEDKSGWNFASTNMPILDESNQNTPLSSPPKTNSTLMNANTSTTPIINANEQKPEAKKEQSGWNFNIPPDSINTESVITPPRNEKNSQWNFNNTPSINMSNQNTPIASPNKNSQGGWNFDMPSLNMGNQVSSPSVPINTEPIGWNFDNMSNTSHPVESINNTNHPPLQQNVDQSGWNFSMPMSTVSTLNASIPQKQESVATLNQNDWNFSDDVVPNKQMSPKPISPELSSPQPTAPPDLNSNTENKNENLSINPAEQHQSNWDFDNSIPFDTTNQNGLDFTNEIGKSPATVTDLNNQNGWNVPASTGVATTSTANAQYTTTANTNASFSQRGLTSTPTSNVIPGNNSLGQHSFITNSNQNSTLASTNNNPNNQEGWNFSTDFNSNQSGWDFMNEINKNNTNNNQTGWKF